MRKVSKFLIIPVSFSLLLSGCSSLYSNTKVVGGVEIKCDEKTTSRDDIRFEPEMTIEQKADTLMGWLVNRRVNGVRIQKHHAAAIVGNMYAESTLNPIAGHPNMAIFPDNPRYLHVPPPEIEVDYSKTPKDKPFGLIQWREGRLESLVNFSKGKGLAYIDPGAQLLFMVHEFETSEKAAFDALMETKDVESATRVFADRYERAGTGEDVHMDTRIEFAKKAEKMGSSGNEERSTMNCKRERGDSTIAELAILLSWPLKTPENKTGKGVIKRDSNCFAYENECPICKEHAKPENIDYRQKAFEEGIISQANSSDYSYADCARFTELVVNLTVDKEFKAYTGNIKTYMNDTRGVPGKWEYIDAKSVDDLQPGDVYNQHDDETGDGHSFIYVGPVDDEPHVAAEASLCQYTARLRPMSDGDFGGDKRWYRFVGTPERTQLF